ncbi:hypothetical protein [Caulobacter sp. RHG1]|uniref:hypothetical protein n=1 Tax=Caulobacter sp. (strain RHG1) TaxID=2545762 RepID=UPI0015567A90|nr:hypothetical protein [Caulobacter sp. RHG1]NQE63929.1 hypothetical protein [Caulobacter sp. RHG1]
MLAILIAASLAASAAPETLAGDWVVDLTPSASAAPYLKAMSLTLAADGTVTGSFYDSDIQAGRWKASKGRTCVSFRTTDGKGPYHTAACLDAGRLTGQTWAEHRNFVFVWDARRVPPAASQ